jgi:phosphate transport system substrate-binding protein
MQQTAKRLGWFLAVPLLAALVGCPGPSPSPKLSGCGSTFIQPVMDKWSAEYQKLKKVDVNYQGNGSGNGIANTIKRTVDFGCTDAVMTEAELKKAQDAKDGGEVLHIPLAMGAVVPAYNLPGIDKPLNFTGEVLADVYLGKIKKWNDDKIKDANKDLADKLPDLAIAPCCRSESSGTTNIWTDYLSTASPTFNEKIGVSKQPKWPEGVTGAAGNAGVATLIKNSKGSIGYIELAYALENGIAYGAVKNKAGNFIRADLKSVSAAAAAVVKNNPKELRFSLVDAPGDGSYPISGTTWAVMYAQQTGDTGKQLAAFFGWATHDGQKFAESLNYAPLPSSLVEVIDEKLKVLTK